MRERLKINTDSGKVEQLLLTFYDEIDNYDPIKLLIKTIKAIERDFNICGLANTQEFIDLKDHIAVIVYKDWNFY